VTHLVVAQRGPKTLKFIVASLTGAWVVDMPWILESSKVGKFVDEKSFGGTRVEANVFEGLKLATTPTFSSASSNKSKIDNLEKVAEVSHGSLVTDLGEADVIVGQAVDDVFDAAKKFPSARVLTWEDMINCAVTGKFQTKSPTKKGDISESPSGAQGKAKKSVRSSKSSDRGQDDDGDEKAGSSVALPKARDQRKKRSLTKTQLPNS